MASLAMRLRGKVEGTQMKSNFGVAAAAGLAVCLTMMTAPPSARAQMDRGGVEVITNGPQGNPGDRTDAPGAAHNLRDSERYDATVRSSAEFRATREREECGPIDDARMHAECLATFGK
jgi:hypothetical protein